MNTQVFQQIINGWDIWLCCGIMISMIIAQSVVFLKSALREAEYIQISAPRRHSIIRAACISSIGPSLSPVIIAMSMVAIVGAPDTWMNLNDIAAARTELATISIGTNFAGVTELGDNIGLTAWSYALWACALNGAGWMLVVFFLNHRMERISEKIYSKYDKAEVSVLMGAAVTSLFCYLLDNQLVGKSKNYYIAAIVSAVCMLLFEKLSEKHCILNEISLGVSMLAGMLVTTALA